ncbi:MAG: class II histone deacetylase [Dongiaceae bacterium]
MTTGLVHDERYYWIELGGYLPLGEFSQPFPAMDSPEGKRRILNLVRVSGLMKHLVELEPRMATEDELALFHTRDYIAKVKELSDTHGGSIGDFTAICAGGYDIAKLAAGGCMVAIDAVLNGDIDNAFAMVRPCGHHAEADRGRGFAIFSNVAVAIMSARQRLGVERVAVIDWDVHHGNGTQWAFYDDPDVLTMSIHQDRLYPVESGALEERGTGRGEGFNLNIPLPPGCGHSAYISTIERVVVPALQAFRPQLIVIASGFDASVLDPLARMMCHSETYRRMTELVMAAAADLCGGRLVVCLEGGYSPVYIPYCGLPVIETLSGHRTKVEDPLAAWVAQIGGHDLQPHQNDAIERAAALISGIR